MRSKCDAVEGCKRSDDINGEIFKKFLWKGNQWENLCRKIEEMNCTLRYGRFCGLISD